MAEQKNVTVAPEGETPKAKCQLCKFVLIFSLVAFFLTFVVTVWLHRSGGEGVPETSAVAIPA